MIIEQCHSNHFIPNSALSIFFGGIPSPLFCDFSLIFIVFFINIGKKVSLVVCVSYHVVIVHYLSNHLIPISAF